ncbi:MAG: omega-amidase [Kosmotogales bacterium]|nr:omega-amidase [Kosmotogales bacterium]
MDRRNKLIKRKVRISVIQMLVNKEKKDNLENAKRLIIQSLKFNPDIVVLPEMFNCPYDVKYFPSFSEKEGEITWNFLSNISKEHKINIIGGSIPEIHNDKIYNTCYIFNRSGNQIGKYRKTHLFDVDIKNGQYFKESDVLTAGNSLEIISIDEIKVGILICYDIRFPEITRKLMREGAKIIFVPAAFNMTTGPLHWEILFRTRALDNQIFFIAASQARNPLSSYKAYGNSLICDPWGRILKKLDEKERILSKEIDLSEIPRVRNQIPVLKHFREDLYK